MIEKSYIQYGCGLSAPPGWRNFDASPTLRFERLPLVGKLYTKNEVRFPANVEYGDVVKGLPVRPESCSGIYASHVLEHLSLHDFKIAIKRTYHLLRPKGIFRMIVPDLEELAKVYISSKEPMAAEIFMRASQLGIVEKQRGLKGLVRTLMGNSSHLWMWDYKSLERELASVGFTNIRRCEYGDSSDPMFKQVEDAARFHGAVAVECMKP